MKHGFILPGGTASQQLELAVLAEASGWDGVFVWEGAYGVDAWSLLSAMAVQTERVHLGTMLTPLPWRRPWKLASQAATVEQLAPGRTVLTVGLGAVTDDLPRTGEEEDLRERAVLLDDGIDLMRALWSGATTYEGTRWRYSVAQDDQLRVSRPARGTIPIWVVAEGQTTPGPEAAEEVAQWADAGCTWWLESNWEMPHHGDARMRAVAARLTAGPPRR